MRRNTAFTWIIASALVLGGCRQGTAPKSTNSQPANSSQANASTAPAGSDQTNQTPADGQGGTSAAQPGANPSQPSAATNNPAGPTRQPPPNTADQGAASAQSAVSQVTIPEGTPIDVRLTDSLGSARSVSGERFEAALAAPLIVDGAVVAPRGAIVTGRVLVARPSGHLRSPAELALTLTSIEIGGQSYRIVASHRSWRGRSHKKHNAKWIAAATGAGALVGALVGHGEGAVIGAGIGAGGGTGAAYATGRKNIVLPAETRLHFVLREPVSVTTG